MIFGPAINMYTNTRFCRAFIIFKDTFKLCSLKTIRRHFSVSCGYHQKCSKTKKQKGDEPPWKILFFGTDTFALESLKPLCAKLNTDTLMSGLGVVTKKGSIVREFAEAEKLPIFEWPLSSTEFVSDYDIGMVVSFGNLIPKKIIDGLPLGCINVHASLLPRWRGASPIIHSIMNGDTETGVTVMRIHPHKFDVGEIVRQYRVAVGRDETAQALERRLSLLGSHLLMDCLRDLPRCLHKAVPQPHHGITYAPRITSKMAAVRWEKLRADMVYNLHRALHHVYPLTTRWRGKIVRLQEVEEEWTGGRAREAAQGEESGALASALGFLSDDQEPGAAQKDGERAPEEAPGTIQYSRESGRLRVACSDSTWLLISRLTIAGKTMSAQDFYNGFLSKHPPPSWCFTT